MATCLWAGMTVHVLAVAFLIVCQRCELVVWQRFEPVVIHHPFLARRCLEAGRALVPNLAGEPRRHHRTVTIVRRVSKTGFVFHRFRTGANCLDSAPATDFRCLLKVESARPAFLEIVAGSPVLPCRPRQPAIRARKPGGRRRSRSASIADRRKSQPSIMLLPAHPKHDGLRRHHEVAPVQVEKSRLVRPYPRQILGVRKAPPPAPPRRRTTAR